MNTIKDPLFAVITADVVNSTLASNGLSSSKTKSKVAEQTSKLYLENQWLETLKQALSNFGEAPKDWQIYRGDSFQLLLDKPESAIAVVLWLRALIKSLDIKDLDLRMAIGIGTVNYRADTILESNGEAFVHSGTLFDDLKKRTLAIKTPWQEIDEQINIMLELAELSIERWTANSANIFAMKMQMPDATQKEIAKVLDMPQSRISEGLDRAGYQAIMKMELYCRELMENGVIIKKR